MPIQNEWIEETNLILYVVKLVLMGLCTYFTSLKLLNIKTNKKTSLPVLVWIGCICIICTIIHSKINFGTVILIMIFSISIIFSIYTKNGIGYSIINTAFSLSINYCI